MDCLICNTKNPDDTKYCGNCGARLDVAAGPVKDMVEVAVRQEVDRALERYLKDQRIAEFDITEKVANRLLGWGKIFGTIIGVLVVLAGILGVKSGYDIKKELQNIVKDIRQQTKNVKEEITSDSQELAKLKSEDAGLRQEYDKLEAALPGYEKVKQNFDKFKDLLAQENQRITTLESLIPPEPIPKSTRQPPFRLQLDDVIKSDVSGAIQSTGKLVFHVTGNTGGVKNPQPETFVADRMAEQFQIADLADRPAFLYLLGSVIYFSGEAAEYYTQFYLPYQHYRAPILAIPGNHDGFVPKDKKNPPPSLAAFMSNFCAPTFQRTPEARNASRTAMIQPNCYWTLETALATIIGLYTNVPNGGFIDDQQKAWLIAELKAASSSKAVIVAMHASPYTDTGEKSQVAEVLDDAIDKAGRFPDIVFSAHANLYMRFTRDVAGRQVPYVIAGTGGYPHLKRVDAQASPEKFADVKREQYDDIHHGFLRVTVTKSTILGEYFGVNENAGSENSPPKVLDRFELDWTAHRLSASSQ